MGEFGGNSNNFWGNFGGNCKSTDFKAFFHPSNKKYIPPTIFYKNNKNIEIYAIIPKMLSKQEYENLSKDDIDGIRISIESDEMGIYKSFNYEIFERRNSIVVAFDGNSSVSNLVQEAKNGKGKSKIYVNIENSVLADKARNLGGYVVPFDFSKNLADIILNDNPEIV